MLSACSSESVYQSTHHSASIPSSSYLSSTYQNESSNHYYCRNPSAFQQQVVGSGYCVAFVQACSDIPLTRYWRQGARVKGTDLAPGSIIATFKNGQYPNKTGYHSAVYISQTDQGIWVWDQWRGQPVHKRLIRFKNGRGAASNDGDAYSVVVR